MSKYSELWQKKKAESSGEESSGTSGLPKLNWFYPNKAVKSSEKGTYMVRVLPIEGKESWYLEFKKHSFKIGSWKNCLCLESHNSKDKSLGKCPICDFLEENKEEIESADSAKALKSKNCYGLMVYDYTTKQILRYEINYYGFMDILGAIVSNEDDDFEFEIDSEGFNLHFEKDENGWAKVAGVNKGKKTIEEIKEILDIEVIPSVEAYTFPDSENRITGTETILKNLLDLALNAGMFPEISPKGAKAKKKVSMDDEDYVPPKKAKSKPEPETESVEDEDDEEVKNPAKSSSKSKKKIEEEEEEPKSKKTTIEDDELDSLLEELDV